MSNLIKTHQILRFEQVFHSRPSYSWVSVVERHNKAGAHIRENLMLGRHHGLTKQGMKVLLDRSLEFGVTRAQNIRDRQVQACGVAIMKENKTNQGEDLINFKYSSYLNVF